MAAFIAALAFPLSPIQIISEILGEAKIEAFPGPMARDNFNQIHVAKENRRKAAFHVVL